MRKTLFILLSIACICCFAQPVNIVPRPDFIEKYGGDNFVLNNHINPEKPDVPLNKNDAFQKVQKRHVQEKR